MRPSLCTASTSDVRLHLVPVFPKDSHSIQKVIMLVISPASLIVSDTTTIIASLFYLEVCIFILFCGILVQVIAVSFHITHSAETIVNRAASFFGIVLLLNINAGIG